MSLFKVEEMKHGRLDDSYAFCTKLQWFTCFCFGGYINFGTKAGPSEGCSALPCMGSSYKISCVTVILSHLSNLIDYKSFFLFPPNCPFDFLKTLLLFLETNFKSNGF